MAPALKDELTTKKLVCLFSSANSGHAQASVCNIVATVHPEAAGALRQECMALVSVGIAWQLKDLLTHSNTQKAVLGCKSLESAFHALKVL
ncbi:Armadillo-like helical [Artemisia annua]|uniref:Armadillo-like helical n=1 Tax=Artemisia annua TaxID=35608 RepID=A0A2U1KYF5_ARTAN|nr:Armadillo-like helical [Artemisia annua]